MEHKRKDIRELSQRYAKLQTLINYVDIDTLKEAHRKQLKNKAVGIDKVTKEEYDKDLEANLKNLISRMKSFSYKPLPVRRTYIPKGNGSFRPLGIPSYEDKLVQGCMAYVLNEVYEPRFLDCSYGFREGRSAHDAIREINQAVMYKGVNYVLDCDIKGFFDNIAQEWLMKFLRNDIADENFLRYIVRFLKAGIMEGTELLESDKGTPQGGLISPVLANVYLHYVLDLWFEKAIKPKLKGQAHLIRYADDFVILFQNKDEAEKVYASLKERMAKFGLELAEDKTKITPFGRFKGTKETFDFLGFTHFNAKTRTNKYTVGHKISKKKWKQKKVDIKKWIRDNLRIGTAPLMTKMNIKLTGMARYYGIGGMMGELQKLYGVIKDYLYKWLNRRSQRKSFNLEAYFRIWKHYISRPHIYVDIWGWNAKLS